VSRKNETRKETRVLRAPKTEGKGKKASEAERRGNEPSGCLQEDLKKYNGFLSERKKRERRAVKGDTRPKDRDY